MHILPWLMGDSVDRGRGLPSLNLSQMPASCCSACWNTVFTFLFYSFSKKNKTKHQAPSGVQFLASITNRSWTIFFCKKRKPILFHHFSQLSKPMLVLKNTGGSQAVLICCGGERKRYFQQIGKTGRANCGINPGIRAGKWTCASKWEKPDCVAWNPKVQPGGHLRNSKRWTGAIH